MSWKEKRLITILSIILAVLCAAVLLVLSVRYRAAQAAKAEDNQTSAADIAQAAQSDYIALSYNNGTTSLSFALNEEGAWYWESEPDFPLNDETVQSILALLKALKPQQTLVPEGTMESYQLDDPHAYLTVADAGGTTTTLTFGKTTTDGTSYYALKNGDESTVYIYDGALMEKMAVPIYSMMELPVLPALTGKTLESITFSGEVSTVLTAQRAEGSAEATWRSGGANVTDAPAVQGLLGELEMLTLTRCVDYKPTDEAVSLCGFDAPAAQVEAIYRTESGAELSFSLTVGAQTLDGSSRYIRLGGDSTIYETAADSLTNLLAIAANGLEG